MWLQSDGAISNRRAINHSNSSNLEGLATLIGSHLTREPTASPVLTKGWKSELMLATNFGSLCPKVTKVGSQNFGYQIWFCTRPNQTDKCNLCVIWQHYPCDMYIHLHRIGLTGAMELGTVTCHFAPPRRQFHWSISRWILLRRKNIFSESLKSSLSLFGQSFRFFQHLANVIFSF